MTAGGSLLVTPGGRLWLGLLFLLAAVLPAPATARALDVDRDFCHAVSATSLSDAALPRLHFSCAGPPHDYQRRSLWLRTALDPKAPQGRLALMLHNSRFDRLAVGFSHTDGTTHWQRVHAGDFGPHWRAGGQIVFEASDHHSPVVAVTLRLDGLAGHRFLRARLLSVEEAGKQAAGMAAATGAALMLLLVSGIYSLSLAIAVRRQYLAWQAAWSGTMLLWGALWSQAHLMFVPGLAGVVTAQICTFLACLAVATATASAVTAVDRARGARGLGVAALLLGSGVGVAGIPLALMRSGDLGLFADLLGAAILADLLVVALYLGLAWRRGSVEARDFLGAWGMPMAVLALVQVIDVDAGLWGGGSQLLMLVAATWQALWLAAAATRRLAQLRVERDHARDGEARAQALARRDPLTGLPNRRGFIDSITPLLDRARADNLPAALLLVDIDRFKSVNDIYGHEAGDAVLCTIGQRIERWEGPMCTVARMGGEEFGLLTIGMDGIILSRFAESVRRGIAACDQSAIVGDRAITASVGVAEVHPACDFKQLYRIADEALYDAKRGGRNRVAIQRHRDGPSNAPDREIALLK